MGQVTSKTVGLRRFESRPQDDCSGCAADADNDLCLKLSDCTGRGVDGGVPIIWIEYAAPEYAAPTRLTKPEIDDLKKRAIELYGATWLHEFGSFVEAEVYQRLGHPMPEAEHGQTTPT